MKRSIVIVSALSIGVIIAFSFMFAITPFNQTLRLSNGDVSATLYYKIDFDFCEIGCEEPEHVVIQITGRKIEIEQVVSIYCNAYARNFWLDGLVNSSSNIIVIYAIFEDYLVTQCVCPVKITGVLKDISIDSFTLKFVLVNNYGHQNKTLGTFLINL